jgi:hypothetical protein
MSRASSPRVRIQEAEDMMIRAFDMNCDFGRSLGAYIMDHDGGGTTGVPELVRAARGTIVRASVAIRPTGHWL